ncbi:MAG: Ldh family oxidoreductase [Caldilineaceae bacterium]|nr:Ldh family oxidoreductase [Caldilineaceae bacterium]HRJ43004.1 Ldh family oxidoreductase [Caldilineaceae bacterium]
MNPGPMIISEEKLNQFVVNVLAAVDVPRPDAGIVADCLLMANLSGVDSHGIVRLAHYIRRLQNGSIKTHPDLRFEQTAPSMAILDGGDGLGHVVTWHATTKAMEMASESGSGVVSIRDSSHFGMAGFYILRMIEEGYIGIAMTATDKMLVPFGAKRAFFGTNPLAIGFPTNGIPVMLDMATTLTAWGKVALARVEGKPIPAEWGIDAEGNPTTDPNAIAGLHPFGGSKGSGLAMIIDIFCSVLANLPWGPHINLMYGEMEAPRKLGHFILAMDVRRLMPLELFKGHLGAMLDEFGQLPPADGFSAVYYPGQIEGLNRERRRAEGIPIDPGLYAELAGLGEQFNVPFPG